jgi:hypothetical protein
MGLKEGVIGEELKRKDLASLVRVKKIQTCHLWTSSEGRPSQ